MPSSSTILAANPLLISVPLIKVARGHVAIAAGADGLARIAVLAYVERRVDAVCRKLLPGLRNRRQVGVVIALGAGSSDACDRLGCTTLKPASAAEPTRPSEPAGIAVSLARADSCRIAAEHRAMRRRSLARVMSGYLRWPVSVLCHARQRRGTLYDFLATYK